MLNRGGRAIKMDRTKKVYGLLWEKNKGLSIERWHFNKMQEVIPEPIVKGSMGIEVGSGCGYDTYIMAKNNPSVGIVSLDISDGVYKIKEVSSGLKNVLVIKGSAMDIPLRNNLFDFAYSYGVLHHTPDPGRCLREIARVVKKGACAYLYLYEDHSGAPLKHFALKAVGALRGITTRIPLKALYALSFLAAPFIFLFFSCPAMLLGKFKGTRHLSERIPFNFATHPFSAAGDLYDRFGAPIEHRFNKEDIRKMFAESGFYDVSIAKMKDIAGWIAWGRKR